jgi:hypothetical protein
LLAAGSAGNALVDAIAAIVQTGHLGVERVIGRTQCLWVDRRLLECLFQHELGGT